VPEFLHILHRRLDLLISCEKTVTPPQTITTRALYEQVAERLRQQIFDRMLQPGDWIDELKLAADFGISRTPMREAIKVLAAEGLVTMKVRRGAYVTELSEDDLHQVFHLMALLEADAAAVACETANPAQLADLEQTHKQLQAATKNRERFFALNEQFHMQLLAIANNRWREQMVVDLRKVMKLNRHHSLLKTGRIEESLAEHDAIMAALRAREVGSVRQAMRQHIQSGLAAASSTAPSA
jgi:DNA-binding GntR family transcriptional regulator